MALPPEQQASYSAIIDSILASSDLNTISAKAIRKGLQEKVDYDLTPQKSEITNLIMERFDRFQSSQPVAAPEPAPTTNGTHHSKSPSASSPQKRKAEEDEDEDDLSDVADSPPPKKVKKAPKAETDEEMAKRMQAELNQRASRATRGGNTKKKPAVKKDKKKPKKKSAAKIRSEDDSEVDGSGSDKPEKEKKGGFHKLMNLSLPLQELVGEAQLSRPQTVKRIWEYVKERDLQQPDDKRNIICDDKLRAVFKVDKVHMFTMNKILATQLYPVDE